MKKIIVTLTIFLLVFSLGSCEKHEHVFIEGKCTCGEKDPNYVAPHVHEYNSENDTCNCGEINPSHEHKYVNGYCKCEKQHPDFGNCALDRDNELCLDSATWNWDYNKSNWDGKGMTIEIMAYPASDYDPYSNFYKGERKIEKQSLINKIEAEYNIDIIYKDYPNTAPWGTERIKWISNGVKEGLDVGDIFVIDSSWIYQLQKNEAIAELYDLDTKEGIFTEYNYVQNEIYNSMASINNKVYAYSNDDLIPDYWLHYNQALIDQYDLPDPAKLWNNNEWTWSAFNELLKQAQTAFDNDSSGQKKWAFGGDYFDAAKGFVAARGGQFIKDGTALLDDEIVVRVYEDLQDIEDLYWEPDGTTVSTVNFRDGLVLFQTGLMWFYGAAERWPATLEFSISAVPYPRRDDDPELKNYQIPIDYQEMYAVRNVKDNETGLTSSILFNILDDLANGLKPEATAVPSFEPAKSLKEYSSYLEARIENQESVKAIIDVVFNHQDLVYFEMIDFISMLTDQGGCFSENSLYPKSSKIIRDEKIKPEELLKQVKPIYQMKLNEVLGTQEK